MSEKRKNLGKWKTLGGKIVYESPWMRVREDEVVQPNGKEDTYSLVESGPPVLVVPITEKNEVYLVEQYRYPTQMNSIEFPAGSVDKGENLLEAAKRELREETGLEAGEWEKVEPDFQGSRSYSDEILSVFIAHGLRDTGTEQMEEEGIVRVIKKPFGDIPELIRSGEMTDAHSIMAYYLAKLHLEKGR